METPQSLIEHIRTAWASSSRGEEPAISAVIPQTDGALSTLFRGTADAVYQYFT